jgi:hypothetical protein
VISQKKNGDKNKKENGERNRRGKRNKGMKGEEEIKDGGIDKGGYGREKTNKPGRRTRRGRGFFILGFGLAASRSYAVGRVSCAVVAHLYHLGGCHGSPLLEWSGMINPDVVVRFGTAFLQTEDSNHFETSLNKADGLD